MAAPLLIPPVWQPGIDALLALPPGVVTLLIGATDRGKTTFAALAARELAKDAGEAGRVAVVDSDVGQSEIGPPGTVGLAWANEEAATLHDLKPNALFFTGAFAPNQAALEHVVGVGRAVQLARQRNAHRILVDTTGFVLGPAARRLKIAKAQAVNPALVIAFAVGDEIADLTRAVQVATGAELIVLSPAPGVMKKPQGLRATRRLTRLNKFLDKGVEFALPLRDLVTVGGVLGSGEPVAPHLTEWASRVLRLPIEYGEIGADGVLFLFSATVPQTGRYSEENFGVVAEHFGARSTRILPLPAYQNVLVGLHDETGSLLNIGRFARFDALHNDVIVFAALSPSQQKRVRLLAFGRVRVAPDGTPAGDVKTGEI